MRRSGMTIMGKLIGLLKPLLHIMFITITMGVLGFLSSIFITIYGGKGILNIMGLYKDTTLKNIFIVIITCGLLRGVLRYLEQYSGHYIAFKLLALLRDKVFKKLRELSPAKLDGEEKGNLISIITSDIELLEVFYAHTIAPICIGFLTSLIMVIYISKINISLGIVALFAYIIIGFFIPYYTSKLGKESGISYRNSFGKMNSFVLDSLKGIREILFFNMGKKRLEEIDKRGQELNDQLETIKKHEGIVRGLTDSIIVSFIGIMLFVGSRLYLRGIIGFHEMIIAIIALASSFGPVVVLSNLSNNLLNTLAAGDRVLNLLEEKPVVEENKMGRTVEFNKLEVKDVFFKYDKENILENINMEINKGEVVGLIGESGCGKSTLLKLLMRFWDVSKGKIEISSTNLKYVNSKSLRNLESLVTQDTFLFNDSILENIRICKKDATLEEVKEAAKKASIDGFIESLENGYDTKVGELGDRLSGGERQRLGLARAFLHDGDLILLDEPTSNLDSLNEKVILKSLKENSGNKTIVIVSHRASTVNIADKIYKVEDKNISLQV